MDDSLWIKLDGGNSNNVFRQGDLVRRDRGKQSAATEALLIWLEHQGLGRVPTVVGGTKEFELLSYVSGEAAFRPWSSFIRSVAWMTELGQWLREYHDAVHGFVLPPGTTFLWGPEAAGPSMLVNHGDLGPWNTLHDGAHLTGVIDWDLARFGSPLDDLAQIALEAVPLKPSTADRLGENPPRHLIEQRLEALCAGYGDVDSEAVWRHAGNYLERMADEVEAASSLGRQPFVDWVEHGVPTDYRAESSFIRGQVHEKSVEPPLLTSVIPHCGHQHVEQDQRVNGNGQIERHE